MTDLDSWLLVNIADCDVGKSDIIFKYTEPTPRKGNFTTLIIFTFRIPIEISYHISYQNPILFLSGINRFLFLVYEQVANVDVDSIMGNP